MDITLISVIASVAFSISLWKLNKMLNQADLDKIKIKKVNVLLATPIPNTVKSKLKRNNPSWSEKTTNEAIKGFKEYLALFILEPNRTFGMPSQGVDEVWHAFLFFPKDYNLFCQRHTHKKLIHNTNNNQKTAVLEAEHLSQDIINTYYTMKHYKRKVDFSKDTKGYFTLFTFDINNNINGWLYTDQIMNQLNQKRYKNNNNISSGNFDISINQKDRCSDGGSF